ncbi:hypothetical protein [Dethiosulfovibrio salsuginis]|uniref:Uncharacterized protein n=1 Tax=Dethiosulfovibrio salsuginis TaxID=561720 RepID=A0A1X7JQA9_9BACT|nr:hypothetical protein [Dethiosulfovibrio salsuginis]SMG30423.1 hypothetical protein SAMN06275492_1156 [Dethiosulfovibrio salsuginis]
MQSNEMKKTAVVSELKGNNDQRSPLFDVEYGPEGACMAYSDVMVEDRRR